MRPQRSCAVANPGMELVFEEVTHRRDLRNEASGVQLPVQVHLVVIGEIEATRLRAAWQKVASEWLKLAEDAETREKK